MIEILTQTLLKKSENSGTRLLGKRTVLGVFWSLWPSSPRKLNIDPTIINYWLSGWHKLWHNLIIDWELDPFSKIVPLMNLDLKHILVKLSSETAENVFSLLYALDQARAFGAFFKISTSVFKIVASMNLDLKHMSGQI